MFLGGSAGDIRMARLAAIEMVCAYRTCSYVELLTVVQLVAFSLTTLDSLCLSMGEDLSLSMILRLRGNANALHRSAERNRCALEARKDLAARQRDDAAAPREVPRHPPMPPSAFQASDTPAEAKLIPPKTPQASQPPRSPAPSPAITPQGPPPSSASVFADAAGQPAGTPPCHLAPSRQGSMRATALGTSASHLLSGADLSSPFVYSVGARTT